MLFGRKKPGFVTIEVEEEQVPAQKAEEDDGEPVREEGKQDLLSYLVTQPDGEDEFGDLPAGEPEEEKELTEAQKLAGYIRARSQGAQLTAHQALKEEVDGLEGLLEEMKADETCQDIASVQGNKDVYYYSQLNMSNNYAMIASLVEEKNLVETIGRMVRFNCKTYPAPTPLSYFERHPYFSTMPQIQRAIALIETDPEYSDIHRIVNSQNVEFLYSDLHMTERYARALTEEEAYTD